jgi:hypothetical protein
MCLEIIVLAFLSQVVAAALNMYRAQPSGILPAGNVVEVAENASIGIVFIPKLKLGSL